LTDVTMLVQTVTCTMPKTTYNCDGQTHKQSHTTTANTALAQRRAVKTIQLLNKVESGVADEPRDARPIKLAG